jgi:glutaredoxin 3
MPVTADGSSVELELFKTDSCYFCRIVQDRIRALGVDGIKVRDTRREMGADRELLARGGKVQVPCLFVDGRPMYESADINAWLQATFG